MNRNEGRKGIEAVMGGTFMRRYGLALLAGAAVSAALAAPAAAATIVVGPGDDIQAAVDSANPGDIVKLLNGRYNQFVLLDKAVRLQGESKTGVILDGAGLEGTIVHIPNGTTGATVKNLTLLFAAEDAVTGGNISGCSVESFIAKGNGYGAVSIFGSNLVVKSGTLRGNGGTGVSLFGSAMTLQSNKFYRGNDAAEVSEATLAKSNTAEDHRDAFTFSGNAVVSDRNSVRRVGWSGLNLAGYYTLTSTKEKVRAATRSGMNVYSGTGPSTVTEASFKKVSDVALSLDGTNTSVTLGKFDACGIAIGCSANATSITTPSVKNGELGVSIHASGVTVSGGTFKNLLNSAVEADGASEVYIENNIMTLVGGNAVDLEYVYSGRVSGNVIGDADAGGIVLYNSDVIVGGMVEEAPAGNTLYDVRESGIWAYGYYASPEVSHNNVTRCGDLDDAGIEVNTSFSLVSGNTVSWSGGTGIEVGTDADYTYVVSNIVSYSETNGILLRRYEGGYSDCVEYGVNPSYGWYECVDFDYIYVTYVGFGNVIDGNTISHSGSEGIDNGGEDTIIRDNVVSNSGIYDFANGGTVNVAASVGNSPGTGDWSSVPAPAQID